MKQLNIKQLATEMVGDGKRPNVWFVTIAYGWFYPPGEEVDMVQVRDALESVTILFLNKEDAEKCYLNVQLRSDIKKVTRQMIGEVIIEDRLTGVVKQKFLRKHNSGRFFIDQY